ncbi:MAG: hypothetical protein JXB48_20325 [Candidatus Latescibacteria bacterium]|nr:hypothetical protein [Candidatus Latescibacterota bacterium]
MACKVFLYKLESDSWTLLKTFSPPDSAPDDCGFGSWVSISANYVVIGADYGGAEEYGEVYIYTNNGDSWGLTSTLTAPEGTESFGLFVTNTDAYAAITGISQESEFDGKVFIYQNVGGTWSLTQTLLSPTSTDGMFGYATKLTDTLLAISDPLNNFTGSVFTYTLNGGQWELDDIYSATGKLFSWLGCSVGVSSDSNYLLAGSPMTLGEKGEAYLWTINSSYITIGVEPAGTGSTDPTEDVQHIVTTNVAFDIKATPATGYAFNGWRIDSGTVTIQDAQCATTTATVNGTAHITAVFAAVANVTFAVSPANSGTTSPEGGVSVIVGNRISIRAVPATGYYFSNWTVTGSTIIDNPLSSTTKALVNGDSSITAIFKPFVKEVQLTMGALPDTGGTVTPSPGIHLVESSRLFSITAEPVTGMHFVKWTIDGTGMISNPLASSTSASISDNSTITAVFAEISSTVVLTMVADPAAGGTTSPVVGVSTVNINQPVQIEAFPGDGYHFVNWTIDGEGYIDGADYVIAWVTLKEDATVTANFAANADQATLTMAVSPDGAGTVNPGVGAHLVNIGESYEIKAQPADGYFFVRWTAYGNVEIYVPEIADTHAVLSGDATATAVFTSISESVTLTVDSSPEDGGTTNPGNGDHLFVKGQSVQIEAFPSSGYYFTHWDITGSAELNDPTDTETVLTIYGNSILTANFATSSTTATLLMSVSPTGAGSTNPGIGDQTVIVGRIYEISATPEDSYLFDKWTVTGGAIIDTPLLSEAELVLSGDATVTANFVAQQTDAQLIITVNPSNSGSTNPGVGIYTIPVGQRFMVEAVPADGYFFSYWEGDSRIIIDDLYSELTSVKVNGDSILTASFTAITTTAQLILAITPEESGATNPGIGTHTVSVGDQILIEAVAESGYHFVRWELSSGSSAIEDLYDVTTYVKVLMDSTITANFASNDTPVTVEMKVSPENSGNTDPGVGTHSNLYAGQILEIKADPADGYHFVNWTSEGGVNITNTLAKETTAVLVDDSVITANFATNETPISLTIINDDTNGGMTYPAPGIYTVYAEESIKLEAAPFENYYFVKWELEGIGYIDDDKAQIAYAVLEDDSTIRAIFSSVQPVFLSYGAVLNIPTATLTDIPKWVYATFYNTAIEKGELKKEYFRIVQSGDESQTMTAEWRHFTQLYDKKDYPKSGKLSELLQENPIGDLEIYAIYLKSKNQKPVQLNVNAYLTVPIVSSVSGDYMEKDDVFIVKGRYFGSKLPTVEIEYMVGEKVKYKRCRVIKKDSLRYQNAQGVDNKSCMKILDTDTTDQQSVNYSQISVKYPKLKDDAIPTGYIIVKNHCGMVEFKLPEK